jgi:hypothetical protein
LVEEQIMKLNQQWDIEGLEEEEYEKLEEEI